MGTPRGDTPSTPGNLYKIVKAFLADFYTESKEGTKRHAKGVAVFLSFISLCFFMIAVAAYKVSEMPAFCGLCHNMGVYVSSWRASSHKNVPCIECHYKPGFLNHLTGKWKDGQISLVYFITGKKITKPHAEIDDASCLQSGCHKKADLKEPLVFKNVIFNHLPHLEQMRRQKQLRCTTCHSQIVQGAHITVTDVECFICHFYKTKGQKAFTTDCTSCHYEPKGDIKVAGFTFNHKRYIKRGIKCDICHTAVVSGDGHIPEYACLQCHNKREILEAKYTAEQLHRNHVTDHKVECFTCHSAIKHEIKKLPRKDVRAEECGQCHDSVIHDGKLSMYTGTGAKFVKDLPNLMARLHMDCTLCHKHDMNKVAAQNRCKDCHGDITDGMVDRWKKITKTQADGLLKNIAETKEAFQGKNISAEARKKLSDAAFNYDFLMKGNPVHNILYSLQILEKTRNALGEVRAKTTGTAAPTPVKVNISCTDLCHGNITDKKVPFGSVNFPHDIHAEGESSCLKCHTPYTDHGNTVMKGCSECHHGKGEGKVTCKDCHSTEDAMLRSKGSMHGKLNCVECHTSVKEGKKENVPSIKANCTRCHTKAYGAKVDEWLEQARKVGLKGASERTTMEKEIEALEAKEGRHSVPLRKVFDEISEDMNSLAAGKYWHNPVYAEAAIGKIKKNSTLLQKMIEDKKAGKAIRLK
jgi:hypothetical protein